MPYHRADYSKTRLAEVVFELVEVAAAVHAPAKGSGVGGGWFGCSSDWLIEGGWLIWLIWLIWLVWLAD